MSEHRWFTVRSEVQVLATSEDDAINKIAARLRATPKGGLYPVGTFDAQPCDPPRGTREEIAART